MTLALSTRSHATSITCLGFVLACEMVSQTHVRGGNVVNNRPIFAYSVIAVLFSVCIARALCADQSSAREFVLSISHEVSAADA